MTTPVRLAADSPVPLGRWIALDELLPPKAWEASGRPILLRHAWDSDKPVDLCSTGLRPDRWREQGYTHWAAVPWPLPSGAEVTPVRLTPVLHEAEEVLLASPQFAAAVLRVVGDALRKEER